VIRIVVLHRHLKVCGQHPCVNAVTAPNVYCTRRFKSCQHSVHCLVRNFLLFHLPFVERVVLRGSGAIIAALHVSHDWISANPNSPHHAVSAVDACVLELLHLLLLEKLSFFELLYLLYRRKLQK